mgnify:CR=1 FL=1
MKSDDEQPPCESGGALRFLISEDQEEDIAELQERFSMTRKEVIEILLQELADGCELKTNRQVEEVVRKDPEEP